MDKDKEIHDLKQRIEMLEEMTDALAKAFLTPCALCGTREARNHEGGVLITCECTKPTKEIQSKQETKDI